MENLLFIYGALSFLLGAFIGAISGFLFVIQRRWHVTKKKG